MEVELLLVVAVLDALLGEPRLAALVHAALHQTLRALSACVLEDDTRPPVRTRQQRVAFRQLRQLLLREVRCGTVADVYNEQVGAGNWKQTRGQSNVLW